MNKIKIKEALCNGHSLSDVIGTTDLEAMDGQGCTIYKAPWPEKSLDNLDKAVYIPDLTLNDLDLIVEKRNLSPEEMSILLGAIYTVRDFLDAAGWNAYIAENLHGVDDWQTPNIQDVYDGIDEDSEFISYFGETPEQADARLNSAKDADGNIIPEKEFFIPNIAA